MYYSIYDNQVGEIRSFAINSKSKNEVRTALINYLLLGNFSMEGEKSIKSNTLKQLCNYYEFTLIKTKNYISEDFEL